MTGSKIDLTRRILTIVLSVALAIDIGWYLGIYVAGHEMTREMETNFHFTGFNLILFLGLTHKYVRSKTPDARQARRDPERR
jgi:uncharacterized protein YneF (UPF0154 family)